MTVILYLGRRDHGVQGQLATQQNCLNAWDRREQRGKGKKRKEELKKGEGKGGEKKNKERNLVTMTYMKAM